MSFSSGLINHMIISSSHLDAANSFISFFLWLNIILLYVYTTSSLSNPYLDGGINKDDVV